MSFKIKIISACESQRELLRIWSENQERSKNIEQEANDQRTLNVYVEKSWVNHILYINNGL